MSKGVVLAAPVTYGVRVTGTQPPGAARNDRVGRRPLKSALLGPFSRNTKGVDTGEHDAGHDEIVARPEPVLGG